MTDGTPNPQPGNEPKPAPNPPTITLDTPGVRELVEREVAGLKGKNTGFSDHLDLQHSARCSLADRVEVGMELVGADVRSAVCGARIPLEIRRGCPGRCVAARGSVGEVEVPVFGISKKWVGGSTLPLDVAARDRTETDQGRRVVPKYGVGDLIRFLFDVNYSSGREF